MSSILKQALQPGLNSAWSTRVLGGSFHREAIVDMAAAWRAAPSTASRILACLDVLQPITYRTAQSVVIVADRILAAPMNVIAAGTGMISGSLFFAGSLTLTVLGLNRGEDGIWSAARAGAAFGYHGVRNIYTFAIRLGLFCCSILASGVGLPLALLHCLVPRVRPPAATIADFVPLPSAQVKTFLHGLDGQGGVLASIANMQVTPGPTAKSWNFCGEVEALFGLLSVARFHGTVTGNDEHARAMTIVVPGRAGLNPIDLEFTPSLLRGRLQMTGRASGFHFWERKPISNDLAALGYTKVEGTWTETQQQLHPCHDGYAQYGKYMRFFRGLENDEPCQEIIYNGGWNNGFSMGAVELKRFPFAVATKLGMLLYLDS